MDVKNKKIVGFASEHSVEFVLVSDLVSALRHSFGHIVPVFFWASREGGKLAASQMGTHSVKLLAVFARRPKVSPTSDSIFMKVNSSLFEYAVAAYDVGMPVIASMPLASDLGSLQLGCECVHLQIDGLTQQSDQTVEFRRSGEICGADQHPGIIPIESGNIAGLLRECPSMEWPRAMQILKHLKNISSQASWRYQGGYRPFHLMVVK